MKASDCTREFEVVEAVLRGRIKERRQGVPVDIDDSGELRLHAETCEVCSEVLMIASGLAGDRETALREVQVPAAGQVWWRAAIRARLEGAQAAARPITWAQGVAGACAAGLTLGVIGLAWPTIAGAWAWAEDGLVSLSPTTAAVTDAAAALVQSTLPIGLAVACLLLAAPLALCLALLSDVEGKGITK
jgi:hypothetical protein